MSKISRNDKCPCGSGKKYKNCCLNREIQDPSLNRSIKFTKEESKEYIEKLLDTESKFESAHEGLNGVREYILMSLDILINELNDMSNLKTHINEEIIFYMDEIKDAVTNPEKYYSEVSQLRLVNEKIKMGAEEILNSLEEIQNATEDINISNEVRKNDTPLNDNEKRLLLSDYEFISLEFSKSVEGEIIDYPTIRVCLESTYNAIIDGIKESPALTLVNIFLKDGMQIDYTDLSYAEGIEELDDINPLNNKVWKNYNNINEYDKFRTKLRKTYGQFKDESIDILTTAEYLKSRYEKIDNPDINYINILNNYWSVFDKEIATYFIESSEKFREEMKKEGFGMNCVSLFEILFRTITTDKAPSVNDLAISERKLDSLKEIWFKLDNGHDFINKEDFYRYMKEFDKLKIFEIISISQERMRRMKNLKVLEEVFKGNKRMPFELYGEVQELMDIIQSKDVIENRMRVDSILFAVLKALED